MKIKINGNGIATALFIFCLIAFLALVVNQCHQEKDVVKEIVDFSLTTTEYAYMEGQKDSIEGDIRIEKNGDDWVWIKSPWDDGDEPFYQSLSEYENRLFN